MVDPSLKSIKASVDEGTSFIEWLVEVLRGKNCVKKLLLIDVFIIAVFNPLSFTKILGFITAAHLPARYTLYFWLVVGLVFVAAVVVALRTKPKPPSRTYALDRRSAIKGLLSFTFNDAEVFTRLQREDNLRECLQSITDDNFHFGILCGESGCGKSSFLQAGLWPRLLKLDRRCAYVKFSDIDPLDSIRAAFTEQLKIAKEVTEDADFLTLLKAAAGEDTRQLILIFDQFEQFFVHHQREAERAPFVEALGAWYRVRHQLPVRILISLRGDFYDHMIELQQAMGYSLGPQQSHRLKRFKPEEATEIFRVIAETEGMTFDDGFVHDLTERELAGREDGLISPVDVQILAWMISGSKGEERAFNRSTYQKFGGIEGLLEVFLSRVLEARETEARRQTAIKVLLALTDLERNVRAGTLTIEALKEKIAGTVSDAEIKEAAEWLGRGDVRLITSVRRKDDEGYELAHERLIPALRKVAGKSLSQADQANQLLDRRVNEWLGNNRASRYLLTWRERSLIERQKPYLIWGPQKTHKEALLAQTTRLWRIRAVFGITPLIITACFFIWWNSESGQLYQIKMDIDRFGQGAISISAKGEVIKGLMYSGRFQQALQLAERSPNAESRVEILWLIAATAGKMDDPQRALALLEQAQQSTARLRISDISVWGLIRVANAAIEAGDSQTGLSLLEQAQQIADRSEDQNTNNTPFSRIAELVAKTGDIQRALQIAERINEPRSRLFSLSAIAISATKKGDIQQALMITEGLEDRSYPKYQALSAIAEAVAKTGDIQRALVITEDILFIDTKVATLSVIAEVVAENGDPRQASSLLDRAVESVKSSEGYPMKEMNEQINIDIAVAAARTGDIQRALRLTKGYVGSDREATILGSVAEAAPKTGDSQQAAALLEQVLMRVKRIGGYSSRSKALSAIAKSAAKIGNLSIGRRAALLCDSDEDKAVALSQILIGWAERSRT